MSITALRLPNSKKCNERLHYVYELRDHEGEVFYVGKGSGARAFSHISAVASSTNKDKPVGEVVGSVEG